MSPQFLVIGYYTKGTRYEELAQKLKSSLIEFSLPYYLHPMEDLGSWEKNTHYKAYFIRQCLNDRNQDLLYVDVDAIFKAPPVLIKDLTCDIAYRTENFKWRRDEALSGTLFLRNNEKVRKFVDRWIQLNEAVPAERMKPETWEQKNMQTAHREFPDLAYFNLPPEYTFIFDHTRKMFPRLNPIIEHFQESRSLQGNNSQRRTIIRKR